MGEENNSKFIKFINLFIHDLSNFFDDFLDELKKINIIEKEGIFVSLNESENYYSYLEKHKKLYCKYKILDTKTDFVKNAFNFLFFLDSNFSDIFMSQNFGEIYCKKINYFFKEITSEKKKKVIR